MDGHPLRMVPKGSHGQCVVRRAFPGRFLAFCPLQVWAAFDQGQVDYAALFHLRGVMLTMLSPTLTITSPSWILT